jgi:GT2 family glycosyltransferase
MSFTAETLEMQGTETGLGPEGDVRPLVVAVGIATAGRPNVVANTVRALDGQTRKPDAIVVCSPSEADVAGLADAGPDVRLIQGPRGLTHQRNQILRHLEGFDAVVFFDDDFIPCARYIEVVETVFSCCPDVAMTTGRMVADGIGGPGFDMPTAVELLDQDRDARSDWRDFKDVYNGYGCNMAVRLAPVREHALMFDEALPLYAWLEDIDFSRRLARYGRIVKTEAASGVHLGTKSGRQSGIRLGYSQIANPFYLVRKGSCSWRKALHLMSRNCLANLIGMVRPEPYIDRTGRAVGNARAFADLLTGRLTPARILNFERRLL